jgi:hypothetical protein
VASRQGAAQLINYVLGEIGAQLVAKAASDYAGAAQKAAAFVEKDAFNAAMFMTDAEQKVGAAAQDVPTLVTTFIELTGALDEQMTAMIHARLVTIAVGAGVAVSLLFFASTLPYPVGGRADRPVSLGGSSTGLSATHAVG